MLQRNYALDLLRGLTIALMIIVNNPGDWKTMFTVLRHAEWHGFLGADIVFPSFLFIAGYAAALKIHRSYLPLQSSGPHCASALTLEVAQAPAFFVPLLRRAVLLFLIGLFLNAWPFGLLPGTEFHPEKLRVMGVLQRIALCVLLGGVILRYVTSQHLLVFFVLLILAVYELCMRCFSVNAGGMVFGQSFELTNNFARFVDISLLPEAMLYRVKGIPFDPEGIFTSLTALTTFLSGGLTYRCILPKRLQLILLLVAFSLVTLGFEPLNKNLWTLSYVCVTASIAATGLTLLELIRWHDSSFAMKITSPLVALGRNPLLVYALSILVGKTLAVWQLSAENSVKQYLYSQLSFLSLSPEWQSLLYSVLLLLFLVLLTHPLRHLPLRL